MFIMNYQTHFQLIKQNFFHRNETKEDANEKRSKINNDHIEQKKR